MSTEDKPDKIGTKPQNILLKMPQTPHTGYEFQVLSLPYYQK